MTKISLLICTLILLVLVQTSVQQPANLPSSVTAAMASREMRYHHFVWHNVRNNWNRLSRSAQNTIRSYGWAPPRPAQTANGRAITDNNSGEDFLYMHRQMINRVNTLLSRAGSSRVSGFSSIPGANDRSFPMPATYTGPSSQTSNLVRYYKSSSWLSYARRIENRLRSTSFLRSMTLGQLGSYIEFTSDVHQGLHFRFSARNSLMRLRGSETIPYVNPRFDVPSSNWLVDLYSSQANPWFWKVHGWIDNVIGAWARANGIGSIRWRGTWTGGSMDDLPNNLNIPPNSASRFLMEDCDSKPNITTLEKIVKILAEEKVVCDYYNDLDPHDIPKDYKM